MYSDDAGAGGHDRKKMADHEKEEVMNYIKRFRKKPKDFCRHSFRTMLSALKHDWNGNIFEKVSKQKLRKKFFDLCEELVK